MRSPHGFIVTPKDGKLYKIDKESIASSSMENHKIVNREALVTSVPTGYNGPIKDGAIVIVHHNVFRKYYAIGGKEKFSSDLITENTYLVPPESTYAYKNDPNDEWRAIDPWCFVRPTGEMLYGEVVFGKDEGCQVGFIPDSECEFSIDGEVLYRIDTNDICLKKEKKRLQES